MNNVVQFVSPADFGKQLLDEVVRLANADTTPPNPAHAGRARRILMGTLSDKEIDDLLARVDIVCLITADVTMSPCDDDGNEFVGQCPFCWGEEKLVANRAECLYHCYQCGKHGSAIGYLMSLHKVDFHRAVEHLRLGYTSGTPRPRPPEPPKAA